MIWRAAEVRYSSDVFLSAENEQVAESGISVTEPHEPPFHCKLCVPECPPRPGETVKITAQLINTTGKCAYNAMLHPSAHPQADIEPGIVHIGALPENMSSRHVFTLRWPAGLIAQTIELNLRADWDEALPPDLSFHRRHGFEPVIIHVRRMDYAVCRIIIACGSCCPVSVRMIGYEIIETPNAVSQSGYRLDGRLLRLVCEAVDENGDALSLLSLSTPVSAASHTPPVVSLLDCCELPGGRYALLIQVCGEGDGISIV